MKTPGWKKEGDNLIQSREPGPIVKWGNEEADSNRRTFLLQENRNRRLGKKGTERLEEKKEAK